MLSRVGDAVLSGVRPAGGGGAPGADWQRCPSPLRVHPLYPGWQVLKQLADAQKELEEAIQEAEEEAAADEGEEAAAANGQDGGSGSDAGSDAGFGFAAEAFSAEQLEVARRARGLLAAVAGLVKAVVRQLLAER